LVDDLVAGSPSRSAVDAVGRRNDDQQLHVASMELLGQEPSRRGRLCRRILESTGGQTLRYGNSEYPQGDGQQHREYDDASRCGNGQQGDPMQQRLSSAQGLCT
jgi:hypothetical protein